MSSASPGEGRRLFGDWEIVEEVEDTVVADGLPLRRVGLTARRSDGAVVTGSAASAGASPAERARYELLERAALLDAVRDLEVPTRLDADGAALGPVPRAEVFPNDGAPSAMRASLSSGVASGPDLGWAKERARLELVERDRLLRAWYGELDPVAIAIDAADVPVTTSYTWRAVTVPEAGGGGDDVVMAVGVPLRDDAPLLRGCAARVGRRPALLAALAEALQGLAFLWGEPVPDVAPTPMPTPMFHLDYYLWPGSRAALLDWLERGHGRFGRPPSRRAEAAWFVDLTPAELGGELRVVRALARGRAALVFGEVPGASHLPENRRVHPSA